MKIELRELETDFGESGTVLDYRAEVWIDGQLAFEAASDGDFGADVFRQVGAITLEQVDAWLAQNRTAYIIDGRSRPTDLAREVGELVDMVAYTELIEQQLLNHVVAIEGRQVVAHLLTGTRAATIAAIRKRQPTAIIVTGDDLDLMQRAARLMFKDGSEHDVN